MRFFLGGDTWISQEVNGSMVRINGLFHLLINGVYWGYNPLTNHLLTSKGTSKYPTLTCAENIMKVADAPGQQFSPMQLDFHKILLELLRRN